MTIPCVFLFWLSLKQLVSNEARRAHVTIKKHDLILYTSKRIDDGKVNRQASSYNRAIELFLYPIPPLSFHSRKRTRYDKINFNIKSSWPWKRQNSILIKNNKQKHPMSRITRRDQNISRIGCRQTRKIVQFICTHFQGWLKTQLLRRTESFKIIAFPTKPNIDKIYISLMCAWFLQVVMYSGHTIITKFELPPFWMIHQHFVNRNTFHYILLCIVKNNNNRAKTLSVNLPTCRCFQSMKELSSQTIMNNFKWLSNPQHKSLWAATAVATFTAKQSFSQKKAIFPSLVVCYALTWLWWRDVMRSSKRLFRN